MAEPLRFYTSLDHEPFLWRAGGNAALLVHGFPGSPREIMALARPLYGSGWTVQGILLPGFASDFDRLGSVRNDDWLRAVESALISLSNDYAKIVLVGNSMGAALSLQIAAIHPELVAGLILFAPFWRVASRLIDNLAPTIGPLIPDLRPFARANFSNVDTRNSVRTFLEDADLDDPEVQQQVRGLRLPVSALLQVRDAGKRGYTASPHVRAPVLICQGTRDLLATPPLTHQLAARLPNLVGYVEVDSDHELAHMRHLSEHSVLSLLPIFAASVADGRYGALR
jgi:esterase/lipase